MDLIPTPDQVLSAAGNVVRQLVGGGIADLRPMPRTLLASGDGWRVHRYATTSAAGAPVLLVTPPAVPDGCYDLRRGCSLVEHLVDTGRPTYLVEYGEVAIRDRSLGIEEWVGGADRALARAVRAVTADARDRAPHLVGWGLGGILALLAAADRTTPPLASVVTLAAPTDLSAVPMLAPARPLTTGTPLPLVDRLLGVPPVQRWLGLPASVAAHLDDTELLAQLQAVSALRARQGAYAGRAFGQVYHRFAPHDLGALSSITAPVLVLAGSTDQIAPVPAVRAVLPLLAGSREARFEIVAGGHLGMLTGRAAPTATWPTLDDWFATYPDPPSRQL